MVDKGAAPLWRRSSRAAVRRLRPPCSQLVPPSCPSPPRPSQLGARAVFRPPPEGNATGAPVSAVRTDLVWPWSHLIPFFAEDIKKRVRAAPGGARTGRPGVCAARVPSRGAPLTRVRRPSPTPRVPRPGRGARREAGAAERSLGAPAGARRARVLFERRHQRDQVRSRGTGVEGQQGPLAGLGRPCRAGLAPARAATGPPPTHPPTLPAGPAPGQSCQRRKPPGSCRRSTPIQTSWSCRWRSGWSTPSPPS
jgi:hypothetical protein